MSDIPGTQGPDFSRLWGGGYTPCDCDYQRLEERPGYFMCSKCRRMQPEHMLEMDDGKLQIKVYKPSKGPKRSARRKHF